MAVLDALSYRKEEEEQGHWCLWVRWAESKQVSGKWAGLGSLLLLLSLLFYFFGQKYKKERAGEKGEELEKYKNILIILKMCSI